MQRARRFDQIAQRAVDAQPHHGARLEGLDVDVRRAVAQRLREQRVDQADDRRIVLALQQVLDAGDLLQQARQVQILREVAGQRRGAGFGAVVGRGDQFVELLRSNAAHCDRNPQGAAQFRERAGARIGTHGDLRDVAIECGNDHALALGKRVGNADRAPIHYLRPSLYGRTSISSAGEVALGGSVGEGMSGRIGSCAGWTFFCSPRM